MGLLLPPRQRPLYVIGFFPDSIAAVVALMVVALPFGGTSALTIMATVFNNVSGIGPDSPFRDFTTLSAVPEPTKSHIIYEAKVSDNTPPFSLPPPRRTWLGRGANDGLTNDGQMGVVWAYVAITPFMVVVSVLTSQPLFSGVLFHLC